MSEHTVTDALTLITRLAEPGTVVALSRRSPVGPGRWWVFKPDPGWPEDPAYTLRCYEVELWETLQQAREAHRGWLQLKDAIDLDTDIP